MAVELERIEQILTSEYSVQNYVQLVQEIFDDLRIVAPDRFRKEFTNFSSHIAGSSHIGNYTTPDGKKMIIFSVELLKRTYVEGSRSTQRSYAKKLIENAGADAALIAFYTEGDPKWRLSYVRLDYEIKFEKGHLKTTENMTPAKRYSFLVGKDEPCHTAIDRFRRFITDQNFKPSLDELEEAFSVEAVTNEFFNLYCEKFKQLLVHLEDNPDFVIEAEQHNFTAAQFAKKLMGQIVFLYFLQKKGWLGVGAWPNTLTEKEYKNAFFAKGAKSRELIPIVYLPVGDGTYKVSAKGLESLSDDDEAILAQCVKGKPWGSGSHKFMRILFNEAIKKKANFFDDYLEPLFYNALNVNRGEQGYDPKLHCRIPFLSGGLFEPIDGYDWEHNDFAIPNEVFSNRINDNPRTGDGILDIFDRYNFTMSEDEPMEREVAIDPEMLGKVFENLLEVNDRKAKGAFYTPREIVHYMCQESLINYLTSTMHVNESAVRDFILYGDFMKDEDTVKEKRQGNGGTMYISEELYELDAEGNVIVNKLSEMDQALANVRVADPAVGSGAFPLGMLNEIVRARQNISAYLAITMNANEIRLMYSLDRSPHNLKYETIKNCIFAADIEPSAVDIAQLRLWLSLVIDDEINPEANNPLDGHRNPLPLPNLECNILCGNSLVDKFHGINLINASELLGNVERYQQQNLSMFGFDQILSQLIETQEKLFNCESTEKKKELLKHIADLKDMIILHQLEGCSKEIREAYEESRNQASKPYMLWQLEFARVFQQKKGFDIVIGNPPYVNIVNLPAEYRGYLQKNYSITKNKVDLYAYFVEMSNKLVNKSGQITFIIPQTWKATDSFEKFRRLIFDNYKMKQVVNLEMGTFDAVVRPVIIQLLKGRLATKEEYAISIRNDQFCEIDTIPISEVIQSEHYVLDTESTRKDKELFKKIEMDTVQLGSVLQFTRGIKTSDDKRFIMTDPAYNECHKVFRGKNIKAYSLNWKGEYIWYRPDLMREKVGCVPHDRALFEAPEKIICQRVNSSMQLLVAYDCDKNYFLDTTIVSKYETLKKGYLMKYILGVMNSKLINYWYCYKYRMPTIGLYELHSIPIRKAAEDEQIIISDIVTKILDKSKQAEDFSELKERIDDIVFDIYGVSSEDREYIRGRI